jgi:hypothetical protein
MDVTFSQSEDYKGSYVAVTTIAKMQGREYKSQSRVYFAPTAISRHLAIGKVIIHMATLWRSTLEASSQNYYLCNGFVPWED